MNRHEKTDVAPAVAALHPLALSGVKVLDLTQWEAGSACAQPRDHIGAAGEYRVQLHFEAMVAEPGGDVRGHRGFAERQGIRDRQSLRRVNRDVLAKASLYVRHAHGTADEAHVQALIPQPLAAMDADTAGLARIHGHPHAGREIGRVQRAERRVELDAGIEPLDERVEERLAADDLEHSCSGHDR